MVCRMVTRRDVLAGSLGLLAAGAAPRPGAAQAGRLAILREIVEIIGAAGESLGKVAEGFEKAVGAGVRTFDMIAARRAEERLFELRARTGNLVAAQQVLVFDNISDYLARPDPETWARVQDKLAAIFTEVTAVMRTVREEDSAFVATDAYQAMVDSLHARRSLIMKLRSLPPPTEPEELALLREAQERYGVLIENLRRANDALAAYLRQNAG